MREVEPIHGSIHLPDYVGVSFGTLMPGSTGTFNIMTFYFCCQAATLAV